MTDVSETKATPNPVEGAEQNGAPVRPKNLIPEDDVPWGSLASFALYKLFSEWQSQGFQLPVASGLQNVPQAKVKSSPETSFRQFDFLTVVKTGFPLYSHLRPQFQLQ